MRRSFEEDLVLTHETATFSATKPSCSSELNRCDLNEIQENEEFLTADQKVHLQNIQKKLECYPQRFERPEYNYLEESALLLLSSYCKSSKYSLCCAKGKQKGGDKCKRQHFCPFCNFLTGQRALESYLSAFQKGRFFHVTLSFSGFLNLNQQNHQQIRLYWDACSAALREGVDQGFIRGAYWVEELKVLSFLPMIVLPHLHAIVDADGFSEATVKQLERVVSKSLRKVAKNNRQTTLQPDILAKPIATEKSFGCTIRYLFKTLDLVQPYREAWEQVKHQNRRLAVELNSEVREFLDCHYQVTNSKTRMHAKGNLHPNNTNFIGVKKPGRRAQQQYVWEVMSSKESELDMVE